MSNRIRSIMILMYLILIVAVVVTFSPALAVAVENVVWIEKVNTTATGNSLQKTSGCQLCHDAGAASNKQITSGDGYVEFTVTSNPGWSRFGLSNGNTSVSNGEINFGIDLDGLFQNAAEIWENGAYTGIFTGSNAVDVFRIAVESGVVRYYKNGVLWYTSTVAPTYPLLADASFRELNATISNAVISGTLSLRTNCGLPDDGQIKRAPNSGQYSYTTFTPPAKGGSYVEPVLVGQGGVGCTIRRMTDSLADFNDPVHHEYSSMRPFNMHNTMLLLMREDGHFYVIDRNGSVIVPPDPPGNIFEFSGTGSEPRWSRQGPNVLYYHIGNQLKTTTVPTCPGCISVVHTFTEYGSITIGGGESDLSDDGDHFVIVGTKLDAQGDILYQEAFLYTISTNTKGQVMNFGTRGYDYFDVTHNNQIIANWGVFGTDRFTGMELFDPFDPIEPMKFLRQVLPFDAHADRGVDLNGDEILVYEANNDGTNPCAPISGIVKIRLTDLHKTCLLRREWTMGTHVSINNAGGWALVSFYDERNPGTSNDPATLPLPPASPNWETMWRVYENELILIKLDGSVVRRLAHHRARTIIPSIPPEQRPRCWYWSTPRAALSGDAKYVVFDSNYAQNTNVCAYTDVYMIFLPALQ
jgi:hypothetical protein